MMKNNIKNSILFLITISLIMLTASCERPEAPIPEEHITISSEIGDGWESYALGREASSDSLKQLYYQEAIEHFDVAAQRNAAEVEAYDGLGWSFFRLGQYDAALSQFSFVKNLATEQNLDAYLADAFAGEALIKDSQRFLADIAGEDVAVIEAFMVAAIEAGETALEYDSNYLNTNNPSFGADALHKMLAQNYYYRHWYSDALGHLSSSNGYTIDSSIPTSAVTILFSPTLDAETRALTVAPLTIDWSDTVNNYTPAVSIADIVDFNALEDLNEDVDLPTVNIFEGNSILLTGADDHGYSEATEVDSIIIIEYPLSSAGGSRIPLALLKLAKGGVFEVSEINTWIDDYITVYLPDGTSYTDTVQVKVPYEGTVEIFNFPDGYPRMIDPSFGDDYAFNYLYLPDEPASSLGDAYEITYNYAYYSAEFTVTSTFGSFLGTLSQQFD